MDPATSRSCKKWKQSHSSHVEISFHHRKRNDKCPAGVIKTTVELDLHLAVHRFATCSTYLVTRPTMPDCQRDKDCPQTGFVPAHKPSTQLNPIQPQCPVSALCHSPHSNGGRGRTTDATVANAAEQKWRVMCFGFEPGLKHGFSLSFELKLTGRQ